MATGQILAAMIPLNMQLCMGAKLVLTHHGIKTSYCLRKPGQHRFRSWLVALRHQAMTWTKPMCLNTSHYRSINILRLKQNGRRFADDVFKCIFLNENVCILIKISLKFVPDGPINNIPALVQVMDWRRSGDKPLSEPMMVRSLTHICVARPQWFKAFQSTELQHLVEKLLRLKTRNNPAGICIIGPLWGESTCPHKSSQKCKSSEIAWHSFFRHLNRKCSRHQYLASVRKFHLQRS